MIFGENHDTNRLNTTYRSDIRKYKMVMTLLATVRGIPQLYYGSEIGMTGNKSKGDADIRQDFPGSWNGDKNNAFLEEERTPGQNEYFDFTSKLFNWRKTKPAVHFGKMTQYIPENYSYVYFRYDSNETIMVILNNSYESQLIKTDRFKENLKNFTTGRDIISDITFDITEEIVIKLLSVLILELR